MIRPTKSIRGKVHSAKIDVYPELENIEITPTVEDQVYKSDMYGFDEVKVKGVQSYIDEDIKPEYIVEGVDILGVVGNYKGIDTSDATVTTDDVLSGKIVYINNEKQIGTMPHNGELQYEPSDEEQVIPTGYTSGGVVKAVDISNLQEYQECLKISEEILKRSLKYTRLEYIETDGKAYIDTGIQALSTVGAELTVKCTSTERTSFFGAWDYLDNIYNGLMFGQNDDFGAMSYAIATSSLWVYATAGINTDWHKFVYDPINSITTIDGNELNVPLNNGLNANLYMFRPNIYPSATLNVSISSCKIYDNGVLVRDFIPVIRNSDNIVCMYDLVTEQYFLNVGTGTFIAGPVIEEV